MEAQWEPRVTVAMADFKLGQHFGGLLKLTEETEQLVLHLAHPEVLVYAGFLVMIGVWLTAVDRVVVVVPSIVRPLAATAVTVVTDRVAVVEVRC